MYYYYISLLVCFYFSWSLIIALFSYLLRVFVLPFSVSLYTSNDSVNSVQLSSINSTSFSLWSPPSSCSLPDCPFSRPVAQNSPGLIHCILDPMTCFLVSFLLFSNLLRKKKCMGGNLFQMFCFLKFSFLF